MTQTAAEPTLGTRAPLLLGRIGDAREDLASYRAAGGYAKGLEGPALVAEVERAGLRGRGGAAFPTAVKLRSVAEREGPRHAVANGEEGEPASVKDRWLLRHRPHLVLDGLLRSARAVAADVAWVYVSDDAAAHSVATALLELGDAELGGVEVRVHRVAGGYVAGEETAAVRALNGGPAKPVDKPPRPFEVGVDGRPTLISNVETLAHLALIARDGAAAFRSVGASSAPGSVLITLSGGGIDPVLVEVPTGTTLRSVVDAVGGLPMVRGVVMGGFFGGVLGPHALDLALEPDGLRAAGTGLGCGAIVLLGEDDCPVAAAADVMAYFDRENAQQCGACFRGTAAMSDVLSRLMTGEADEGRLAKLAGWSTSLRGRGACGTLDAAAQVAASLLREFPAEIAAHGTAAPCGHCTDHPLDPERTRFAVDVSSIAIHSTLEVH